MRAEVGQPKTAVGRSFPRAFVQATIRFFRLHGGALLLAAALLALWEVSATRGAIRAVFFPPPTKIWARFTLLAFDGTLLRHTGITVLRLLAAFGLAAGLGVPLGLAMGMSKTIRTGLAPIIGFIYPVPSVLWLPTLATLLGRGTLTLVLTGCVTSFFLVAISTMSGVERIEPVLLEAARNYGATGPRLLFRVLLPGALPSIFTGLRLGLGFSIIVVLAAEILISNVGLGGYIWESWGILRIENMYAALMVTAVLGVLASSGVNWIGARLMPWQQATSRTGGKR